jgi:hypothetical protein
MRTTPLILAALAASAALAAPPAESPAASSSPGYVDGSMFRALIDEDDEVVEVNLEGPMLRALANSKSDCAKDVLTNLNSVHAVIGTVKGPGESALKLVQQMDQKLAGGGWLRVTRIKDESDWVSVLTHATGDHIDGLVALIFELDSKEIVFANLSGAIDLNKLGDLGDCLNVPGLEHVPGAH